MKKTPVRIARKQKEMIVSRITDKMPFKLIVNPDHRNMASTIVWIKDDNGIEPFIEICGQACGNRTRVSMRRSVDNIARQIEEQYPKARFQVAY